MRRLLMAVDEVLRLSRLSESQVRKLPVNPDPEAQQFRAYRDAAYPPSSPFTSARVLTTGRGRNNVLLHLRGHPIVKSVGFALHLDNSYMADIAREYGHDPKRSYDDPRYTTPLQAIDFNLCNLPFDIEFDSAKLSSALKRRGYSFVPASQTRTGEHAIMHRGVTVALLSEKFISSPKDEYRFFAVAPNHARALVPFIFSQFKALKPLATRGKLPAGKTRLLTAGSRTGRSIAKKRRV